MLPILIHCDSTNIIGRVQNRYYNDKSRSIRKNRIMCDLI